MTTPSWWRVPKAPLRCVGASSPTYMGVSPVHRPQNTPMTSLPMMTISKDLHRLDRPIRVPPRRASTLARSMDFRLGRGREREREEDRKRGKKRKKVGGKRCDVRKME